MLTIALVLTALTVTTVRSLESEAAKGGNPGKPDNGGGKPSQTIGTVLVTPNPAPVGTQNVTVTGNGFKENTYYAYWVLGVCCAVGVTTDSTGSFSSVFTRNFDWPSTYTLEVLSQERLTGKNKSPVVATTTFTIE